MAEPKVKRGRPYRFVVANIIHGASPLIMSTTSIKLDSRLTLTTGSSSK